MGITRSIEIYRQQPVITNPLCLVKIFDEFKPLEQLSHPF